MLGMKRTFMNEILIDKKFDKRVAGVIRWLERLKKSYSSGAMENALMDAECARADLENLRLDVWATLDTKGKQENKNKFLPGLLNFSRVVSLAALIVLLTGLPVSKEIKIPAVEYKKEKITFAEPIIVIREDSKPKTKKNENLKENLKIEKIQNKSDNNNIAAVKAKKTTFAANVKKTQPAVVGTEKNEPDEEEKKTVAYDKIFSLIQTGERALKNNSSVIKNN